MPSPRLRRWAILALVCVGSLAPANAATPAGGVYAIIEASAQNQVDVVTQALQTPGVDGLLIHLRWGEISPSLKKYDWTTLDQAIQLAVAANKRFEIDPLTSIPSNLKRTYWYKKQGT